MTDFVFAFIFKILVISIIETLFLFIKKSRVCLSYARKLNRKNLING